MYVCSNNNNDNETAETTKENSISINFKTIWILYIFLTLLLYILLNSVYIVLIFLCSTRRNLFTWCFSPWCSVSIICELTFNVAQLVLTSTQHSQKRKRRGCNSVSKSNWFCILYQYAKTRAAFSSSHKWKQNQLLLVCTRFSARQVLIGWLDCLCLLLLAIVITLTKEFSNYSSTQCCFSWRRFHRMESVVSLWEPVRRIHSQ